MTTKPAPSPSKTLEVIFSNALCEKVGLKILHLHIRHNMIFLVVFPWSSIVICVHIFKIRPWKSSTIIRLSLALTDLLYPTGLPFLMLCYWGVLHFWWICVQVHLLWLPLRIVQQHPLPPLLQCLLLHGDCSHHEVLPHPGEHPGDSSGLHNHLVDVTGSCQFLDLFKRDTKHKVLMS